MEEGADAADSLARALTEPIAAGAGELAVDLPDGAAAGLARYLALLDRWNRVYNLTAIRDPAAMVSGHVLDCLACLPFVQGPRVLDVGSGAGLPGIVFALADPRLSVTVLDANLKKTRFLTQCVIELELAGVDVVRHRVQAYRPDRHYTTIVSRAYAAFPEMVRATDHLARPGQRVLAMKGPGSDLEGAEPALAAALRQQEIRVPGLAAGRRVLWLDRA